MYLTHYIPIAPPRLLFTQITPYVRRVDLDGRRVVTLYTGGQPRGITFDYRFISLLFMQCNTHPHNNIIMLVLHTGGMICFGQMTHTTESGELS